MADSYIADQAFTTNQTWEPDAGDTIYVSNCTFDNCKGQVLGEGNVVTRDLTFSNMMTGAVSVISEGIIQMFRTRIIASLAQDYSSTYSGLTVRGATGGSIINTVVKGYGGGNGILFEAQIATGKVIDSVTVNHARMIDCRGGMWLLNTNDCIVKNFIGINSTYYPLPAIHSNSNPYPCILDQLSGEDPRLPGNTTFSNIRCRKVSLGSL